MIPYFRQPTIDLGPLSIHGFGLLVVVAIMVGSWLVGRRARAEGVDAVLAGRLVGWLIVGGFIGAHLVDRLIYFPEETRRDPLTLLKVWAGISSFGGFLGGVAAAAIFIRREKIGAAYWRYLDAIAWAFPFGWFFGRMGCFVAYDHPGAPTDFFLGQTYSDGVVRHNLGLDEALAMIPIAALFALLGRRPRPPGFYVGLLAVVYAPVRFLFDFLRLVDVRYFGLTPGQWGSIALLLFGAGIVAAAQRRGRLPDSPP